MSPLPPAPAELVYRLESRVRVTPVVAELRLAPVGEALSFLPGQYVVIGDEDGKVPLRSYSLADVPTADGRLTVLVTEVETGATSTWLARTAPIGQSLSVSGPFGTFVADPTSTRPVLGLAGGSGLAPILSLAHAAVQRGVPHPFTVLFSARTEDDLIHRPLLSAWQEEHENFRYLRTLTRAAGPPPVGRVPVVLADLVPDLSGHEVFAAGAPGFVSACVQVARELGCEPGMLHTEEFYAEPQPWG